SSASQAGACPWSVMSHLYTVSGRGYPSPATAGQQRWGKATVSPSIQASARMTAPRPTLLLLAVCLALGPVAQANDLPSLGDASSAIVAPEQEYQLGRAWLSMLRGQVSQLSDPLLKDFVERHVYRLAETSQLHDRRLEFVILDSPQLNAFAVP